MSNTSLIRRLTLCIASCSDTVFTRRTTDFNPSPIEIISVVAKSTTILYVRDNDSVR